MLLDGLPYAGKLRRELGAHHREVRERMTIVEKMDRIKAALGHSPDFADSLLGACWRRRVARRTARASRSACAPRDRAGSNGGPGLLSGRPASRCYMNSSPQCVQVLKPTPAKLYCLQDGHRVTCVPQSIHLIESFDCHTLKSRLGIFRGFDNKVDPVSKEPTIYSFSSSTARAINPVCRSHPGQTVIARRSVLTM